MMTAVQTYNICLTRLEAERDDAFDRWLETQERTKAWYRGLCRLHDLDLQIAGMKARLHIERCRQMGVPHLRLVARVA
jgi:hypothetical protein